MMILEEEKIAGPVVALGDRAPGTKGVSEMGSFPTQMSVGGQFPKQLWILLTKHMYSLTWTCITSQVVVPKRNFCRFLVCPPFFKMKESNMNANLDNTSQHTCEASH